MNLIKINKIFNTRTVFFTLGIISCIIIISKIPKDNIPFKKPDIKVVHNNKEVSTINGEFNWFNKNSGGNSNLAESLEDLKEPLNTKSGETINIRFEKAPKNISINEVSDIPYEKLEYSTGDSEKEISFTLPEEKGTYYIEVSGFYDETHSNSEIFKVIVE